ncbi:hypothetical protein BDA96_03G234400 [Sorghum bicolor]|uniref:Uncharacterized protein n=1 Tax=Sorghum bicolor TaxID=4558 RepID=A0A921RDJ1_SORBI|nr:hypothetical protein BDA96_03G234400 [Sorghum bicolor]
MILWAWELFLFAYYLFISSDGSTQMVHVQGTCLPLENWDYLCGWILILRNFTK